MSAGTPSYVDDPAFAADYRDYQRRYAGAPRESDRVILDLARAEALRTGPDLRLLDVGCSTGNLLRHLRGALPEARLAGGDLMTAHLDACRADPALAGVELHELDATDMPFDGRFDMVTTNAVLCVLDDDAYAAALRCAARALAPGGLLVSFDWLHPFEQELVITERSRTHPEGIRLFFRSFATAREAAARAGFPEAAFEPFRIPIDLPRPRDDGDLTTHTVGCQDAGRLQFRGALAQPWCHMIARRPA